MDKSVTPVQTACQGIFLIAVTVISLSYLLNIFKKYYSRTYKGFSGNDGVSDDEGDLLDNNRHQQAESRQKMQEDHDFKASDYNERIMKPQEEAKRLKKEKEFFKFLAPAWQTEGAVLGGDASQADDDSGLPEGRKAARKRTIPEQINQKVADEAAAAADTAARQKSKRIIKLPEEPDMNQEGVISVMLRTPIGTVCQHRFYASDKIQCLLDFITTQGFNQRQYRVCTSFPRMLLDNPNSCLSDYNFGRRVALNIEEKD